ncbi:dihydroflavonol-4-reductase [Filimonas sp.]|nr:dihydroflavonol-4-reductase [Filimonas sp.]
MILITGASGLLGQHLLETLSAGQKVRATFRNSLPVFFTDIHTDHIEWVDSDINDIVSLEKAFEGITHVYHCAAMVSYDPKMREAIMQTNSEGTANVVNLCLDKKVQKLCFVSSIATLGEGISGELISEKNDWEENKDNSNYAISKQAAEMEVWRGIAEGLNAVIINPGIILGEGDDTKSSTNLFKIVHDEFAYYTAGATCWVDVKDVVRSMVALMNSDIQNERFIISGGNYSLLDIFTMMARAMGKKPPSKAANSFMTEIVWRFSYLKSQLTGKAATISKETARSSQRIRRFDSSKLLKALPDFRYTDIGETIQRVSSRYMTEK